MPGRPGPTRPCRGPRPAPARQSHMAWIAPGGDDCRTGRSSTAAAGAAWARPFPCPYAPHRRGGLPLPTAAEVGWERLSLSTKSSTLLWGPRPRIASIFCHPDRASSVFGALPAKRRKAVPRLRPCFAPCRALPAPHRQQRGSSLRMSAACLALACGAPGYRRVLRRARARTPTQPASVQLRKPDSSSFE